MKRTTITLLAALLAFGAVNGQSSTKVNNQKAGAAGTAKVTAAGKQPPAEGKDYTLFQRVRLMEKKVGQTFTGAISGVTRFGIFVVLHDPFVEGLVHMTNLKDDSYFFDEVRVTLRGKRTGQTFRMGQPVKILLAGANIIKRQLDFELLKQDRKAK